MSDLRIRALELATLRDEPAETTVKRAEKYLAFLSASTSLSQPTPTASPLATTEPEPARLDAPEVVAETKAAIESPSVTGDAPVSSASPTSDATAASGSAAAPSDADAPAAAGSIPDVKDVNTAVLAYNKAHGRDKTLVLLREFGGDRVPAIDTSRWAELLAKAQAGVA